MSWSPAPGVGADSPTIVHVDMDAFYAAVEALLDPTLRGRPLIVGGTARRGVVAACSYEARAYGIRSAMPSAQARRLCPHAVFLSARFDRYTEFSRQLHQILESFTPQIEPIALDEAFLDVGRATSLFGSGRAIATAIRRRVADELGLSASVGVAGSKLIAKLASQAAKPTATLAGVVLGRGVVEVMPGEEIAFLHPKPIEVLWGIGPATATRLRRLGVSTVGELAAVPLDALVACLGANQGRHLHALASGRDERPVEVGRPTRSVGHEQTYQRDKDDAAELHREVVRMADAVASRLRAGGLAGRTVVLKVRFGDFSTITRSQTFPAALDTGPVIARAAAALLGQVDTSAGVRLLGVSVTNLGHPEGRQLVLDMADGAGPEDTDRGRTGVPAAGDGVPGPERATPGRAPAAWDTAARAVDQVRQRFGDGAVGPAVLLADGILAMKRAGDTQWGPNRAEGDDQPSGDGRRHLRSAYSADRPLP